MGNLRALFLLTSGLFASAAWSGATTSTVSQLLLYDTSDLVYVYPAGGVTNPPACHGSNGDYYSFSINRSMGQEYLSALLAAQARGASVTFVGKGTCTDQSVSETLNWLRIYQ